MESTASVPSTPIRAVDSRGESTNFPIKIEKLGKKMFYKKK